MTAIIVDTSAVLASLDEAYAEHQAIAGIVAAANGPLIVSPMIAAESDYMLYSRLGAAAARQFAADVAAEAYELPEWTATDHAAALDVINRNSDDSACLLSTSGTSGGSGRYGERTISRSCLTTCEEVKRFSGPMAEGTTANSRHRPLS
jgi:predicted nucleic acid-binding protein